MMCFASRPAQLITSPTGGPLCFLLSGWANGDNSQDDLGSCVLIVEPPSAWVPENWRESYLAELFTCPELLGT